MEHPEPKPPTIFKKSAETSKKNIAKNTKSPMPHVRPDLVSILKNASMSMKIETMDI